MFLSLNDNHSNILLMSKTADLSNFSWMSQLGAWQRVWSKAQLFKTG